MNPGPSTRVTGYVLAGGRSSRMGRDKAWLDLRGSPLAQLAAEKLKAVCAAVFILSADSELSRFAPIVPDLHPHCGPLSGLEAALAHSPTSWSLLLAVDMPFFPAPVLRRWAEMVLDREEAGARMALLTAGGFPQPALLLVHRDLLPYAELAIVAGEFKLYKVLQSAALQIASCTGRKLEDVFIELNASLLLEHTSADVGQWFLNLNTPEDFKVAGGIASNSAFSASEGE